MSNSKPAEAAPMPPSAGGGARATKYVLLCVSTLPASFPLLRGGFFSSSDGMIHLYRVFELDRAIHAGFFFPRWFPLSGYGYGLPVLNYYSPLMYYLAEFFNLLGAGYISSIKLFIAFTFIAAAFSMFFFARDLLGDAAAFVASIAFVYLPYLLSDAYIRGNFPEMLAMSLIPFALYAFRRVFINPKAPSLILAAISFALIILTHHLTAMLAAPLIGVYIIFLFALEPDWKKFSLCIGAISLSLLISAFYWVPALTELNLVFVGPSSLARFLVSRLVTLEQFFAPSLAYTYIPQSDALQHSAGFPQTVAALLVGIIIILSLRAPKGRSNLQANQGIASSHKALLAMTRRHGLFFTILLLVSIFMTLNLSAPLWYAIPTLRFMQFPWRFQILAGTSMAFLVGAAAMSVGQMANSKWQIVNSRWDTISLLLYLLVSLSLIFLGLVNLPDRTFYLTDSQVNLLRSDYSDYVVAQMGWSWTREFVPAAVREENVVGTKQRSSAPPSAQVAPMVRIENDGLLSRTLLVGALEPAEISLHQFYFPGWNAYIDGAIVAAYPTGALGLVTVNAPAGDHLIEFRFEETPYRAILNAISGMAFLGVVVWLFASRQIAVLAAIFFLGAPFGFQASPASAVQTIALSNRFGDNAALVGYSTERAGDALYVTLHWFTLREMREDFIATVQLLDANGKIIAQNDSLTDWGVTPTSRWQPGEMITDRRVLRNVPRGMYHLVVGMYLLREPGIENLAAYDRDGKLIGNQVELGSLEVGN